MKQFHTDPDMLITDIDKVFEQYSRSARYGVTFVDVCELESFCVENDIGILYDDLSVGEVLELRPEETSHELSYPRINVLRADGTELGMLPVVNSIMPFHLIGKGIKTWATVEHKQLLGSLINLIVAVYCENY